MSDVVNKLSTILDPARISVDAAVLDELSWDALSEGRLHPRHPPQLPAPLAALNPISTEEVRRIVEFANAENVALVPFGGGSGLMGGALSVRPCLVIDLRSMIEFSKSTLSLVPRGFSPAQSWNRWIKD